MTMHFNCFRTCRVLPVATVLVATTFCTLAVSAEEAAKKTPRTNDPLIEVVDQAIEMTSRRYLIAVPEEAGQQPHTPWQIMHGIVAMRGEFEVKVQGDKVNAIDWISSGPTYKGEAWFEKTRYGGRAHPFNVPYAFEGHPNQFLAILTMTNLPLSHTFVTGDGSLGLGETVTMADMIRHAKKTVSTNGEITWTLWFLTHYVDQDEQWINADREPWSMERLVRIQTKGKVTGTACGGTHGLFAIAYARNAYLYKHRRLSGAWLEADQKIQQYVQAARSMQNSDGSFSSEFFKGRGQATDFNERLKSSGHMLEWLMMALPQQRLKEQWVRNAVYAVSKDLIRSSEHAAECGPLYHALDAIRIYRDRVAPVQKDVQLAEQPKSEQPKTVQPKTVEQPAQLPSTEQSTVQTTDDAAAPTAPTVLEGPRLSLEPITSEPVSIEPKRFASEALPVTK